MELKSFFRDLDEMPKKAETYSAVMDDFEKKIMPGVLHWNHPNFFAYFGAGNGEFRMWCEQTVAKTITLPTTAYPSVLGDMLSSGIASIGFSWVSI